MSKLKLRWVRNFWGKHKHSRVRSHWLGHGNFDRATWLRNGQRVLEDLLPFLREYIFPLPYPHTMIEFGVGGGSVSYALAPYFTTICGVDVAQENLDEAGKQIFTQELHTAFSFRSHLVDAGCPEEMLKIGPVSLFLSYAVFQHLPGPEYARRVLATAVHLAPYAYIQFRVGRSTANLSKLNCYKRPEGFERQCEECGWEVVERVGPLKNSHAGYARVFLKRG